MKTSHPTDPAADAESAYEAWRARRREDFRGVDLTFEVMATVRARRPRPQERRPRLASFLAIPSPLVGAARLLLFVLLILTPA